MKKKAMIVQGGWDGHEPEQVADVFERVLEEEKFDVTMSNTLDAFGDAATLAALHLIIPIWTFGKLTGEQTGPIIEAVANGLGVAGCHGGMCDAFRDNVEWQFMTGANWVSHPGGDGVEYTVDIKKGSSPIVEGLESFKVKSEQYYLHVDPAIEVLATTRFPVVTWYHSSNGTVDVPQVWTKRWGVGRVFYSAIGHHADIFDIPEALELMRRGFRWAAEGRDIAIRDSLSADNFKSDKKMF